MDVENLLRLKVGKTNGQLNLILDRLSFQLVSIKEDFGTEVVVVHLLQRLILRVQHIQIVLVVGALDLNQLLSLRKTGVLSNDDV